MIRLLAVLMSGLCVAIVLAQAGAILLAWQGGWLTAEHLREIRQVFRPEVTAQKVDVEEPTHSVTQTMNEVAQSRSLKILELDRRETELAALKNMVLAKAAQLDEQRSAFQGERKVFEEQLAKRLEQLTSESTEQSRGVLLALPPREAMVMLMSMTPEENLVLLKGMTEKAIAKILKEFSTTPEQIQRGQKIFEGLSKGDPARAALLEGQKRFENTN